jgi:(S)-2-hydroxyglutarate dehydrogenase
MVNPQFHPWMSHAKATAQWSSFCRWHGLKHEVCGKVIVATKRADLTLLDRLYRRGLDHRLAVTRFAPEQV